MPFSGCPLLSIPSTVRNFGDFGSRRVSSWTSRRRPHKKRSRQGWYFSRSGLDRLLQRRKSAAARRVFDRLLAKGDLGDYYRRKVATEREAAVVYQRDWENWTHQYRGAIEYPASQIFVRLRSGALPAKGRLLPGGDFKAARSQLETDGRDVFDFAVTDIPPTFWSLQGMVFDASAAGNGTDYYCHISCHTDDVLSAFPGERQDVTGVRQLGIHLFCRRSPTSAVLPSVAVVRRSPGVPSIWKLRTLYIEMNCPRKRKLRSSISEAGSPASTALRRADQSSGKN